jgi:nucleotide-binding universal stress UspA family protein
MQIKRLMCPLDGSELSERALPTAERLARRFGAELLLLRVVEPYMPAPAGVMPMLAFRLAETSRQAALPYLERWQTEMAARGLAVRALLKEGGARTELIETVTEQAVDLIVMSSHGRTGGGRFLLGSVAEGVMRHASCPVLLVRGEETAWQRLLVPLDGSPNSLQAIPVASALAEPGSQVELLRCAELEGIPLSLQERETIMQAIGAELEAITVPGTQTTRRVVEGQATGSILAERADLIVITSHGRTGLKRWLLGSVAEQVARYAESSVLVVPIREPR